MGNDKTNVFLVAIVGIVAMAGLVFLFSEKGNETIVLPANDATSSESDFTGMATAPQVSVKCDTTNTLPGEIGLDKITDTTYQLRWFDGQGLKVNMPLKYAEGSAVGNLGLDTEVNLIETKEIKKNDFFVLTPKNSKKSFLLQYKGADNPISKNPKMLFKDIGSGTSLNYTFTKNNPKVAIKIGGYSFNAFSPSPSGKMDFNIMVDLDGNGNPGNTLPVQIYAGGGIAYNFDPTFIKDQQMVFDVVGKYGNKVQVLLGNTFGISHGVNIKAIMSDSTVGSFDPCNYFTAKHPDGKMLTFEIQPKN